MSMMYQALPLAPGERPNMGKPPIGMKHALKACTGPIMFTPNKEAVKGVVLKITEDMHNACKRGDIVDLGMIPDDVIRKQSVAYHNLAHAGAIEHPFGTRPYILTHTWQGDTQTIAEDIKVGWDAYKSPPSDVARFTYLVDPTPDAWGDYTLSELLMDGAGTFMVSCITKVSAKPGKLTYDFVTLYLATTGTGALSDEQRARSLASAAESISAGLCILNTKGIKSSVKPGRIRRGKVLIPRHHKVETRDYVTAISSKRGGPHKSGTTGDRAPVIPHLRRGHWALIPEGHAPHGRHRACPDDPSRTEVWRSEALVNCASEKELSFAARHRVAYKVGGA